MRPNVLERWGAASGLLSIALGVAAAAFERPWPDDPAALSAFIADHRSAILAQSLLFVLSAAAYLWFLGSLRSFLLGGESGSGRLTGVAFGAGLVWAGMNIAGQAPQIVLTLPAERGMAPGLARAVEDLGFVMLGLANLPMAVLLAAVAVVTLRTGVLPRWLGWLAVVAGAAAFTLTFGVAQASGPLAPSGWLTYALYPATLIWLLPAPFVMIHRLGRPAASWWR